MKQTIASIVDGALCTGCGGCAGLCPTGAISMIFSASGYLKAHVERAKCVECGRCRTVCPSIAETSLYPKDHNLSGECAQGYVGYATDPAIRAKSQSGGIVTGLLCYLLRQGLIDGAVVNRFDAEARGSLAHLATSESELIDCAGSYYTQSAVAQCALQHKDLRLAAVVLGCQAQSMELTRRANAQIKPPEYTIGLICGGQNSRNMMDDLAAMAGLTEPNERIEAFRFRDKQPNGWPGDVSIGTSRGQYALSKQNRHALKPIYECQRCGICFDKMNLYSDIVCGDPWGIQSKQDPQGHTVVIARTEKGKRLIEQAAASGDIFVEPISPADICKGQGIGGKYDADLRCAESVYAKHRWPMPYPQTQNGIPFTRAFEKQLVFARQAYLSDNPSAYRALLGRRKLALQRSKRFSRITRNVKRLLTSLVRG